MYMTQSLSDVEHLGLDDLMSPNTERTGVDRNADDEPRDGRVESGTRDLHRVLGQRREAGRGEDVLHLQSACQNSCCSHVPKDSLNTDRAGVGRGRLESYLSESQTSGIRDCPGGPD